MSDPVEELAEALFALTPDGALHRRKGVVQSTSAGTATIRLGGSTTDVAGARCLTPVVAGDVVEVVVDGPAVLVLGHLDAGWTNLTLSGGATVVYQPKYRKVGGIVRCAGQIGIPGNNVTFFTLPAGCRPADPRRFATNSYNGANEVHGVWQIAADGTAQTLTGTSTSGWVSLDSIQFIAEQ